MARFVKSQGIRQSDDAASASAALVSNLRSQLASIAAAPTVSSNYVVSLEAQSPSSVDLNSSLADPQARLVLVTENFLENFSPRVTVHYRAYVSGFVTATSGSLQVDADPQTGKFSFPIPQHTTALEVTVGVKTATQQQAPIALVEYFPPSSATDMRADQPITRQCIRHCNKIAIDTSGIDHEPIPIGSTRVKHQLGPCRASRAMAIVHIAMMEAYVAIVGGFSSYTGTAPATAPASVDAAIIQATQDALLYLYPSHEPRLVPIFDALRAQIPDGAEKTEGITVGHRAAADIIALRTSDGSAHAEPVVGVDYFPSGAPGEWEKDPITNNPVALGARWGTNVRPFVLDTADQFFLEPAPALDSLEYAMHTNEVISMGGDGAVTPTVRSKRDIETGIFWAYDGTPSLCAPPRLYNQVAWSVIDDNALDTATTLRLLTTLNVGMADTGIAAWYWKWTYKGWRPVTGVRRAAEMANPHVTPVAGYTPYGAPQSNVVTGTHATPNFASHPSGHATFGGLLFEMLRLQYGKDDVEFSFNSDEFNGITTDSTGTPRPKVVRRYANFTDPEEENGQSRIYLGIHYGFEKTGGIKLGNEIADYIFTRIYTPL